MCFADNPRTVLALDTGSPVVSLALAVDGSIAEQRTMPQKESSKALLPLIDEILSVAAIPLNSLGALLALQGPGSFTGLRVGLSTALGLYQALGLPATAVPTLQVLAAAAGPSPGPTLAAVDALRGAWFTQLFQARPSPEALPRPRGEAAWTANTDLLGTLPSGLPGTPLTVVALGVESLRQAASWPEGTRFQEPAPLAATAALLARRLPEPWDPTTLTRPLYLRPPAVHRPKR